jgi:leader peptidase (prepilin peptidase) / N-methyltransferase
MNFPIAETFWLVFVFLIGINVGSFLNVVIGRLPLEKSILWPNSRCLSCLHSLTFADNLPIIGWLRLRGRCRYCSTPFSSRYMWVELGVGLGFAAIWYLDAFENSHGWKALDGEGGWIRATGFPHWYALVVFLHHAVLFSLLVSVALCDWDNREIPLSLTTFGTVIGLVFATCCPWPYPNNPADALHLQNRVLAAGVVQKVNWCFLPAGERVPLGLYPWPLWGPVPEWLNHHRWALGLATGLIGATVGMMLIRFVKFTFEKGLGKEAVGLGDADLMMMAGAFIGWQPVVVAFFLGALVSLPLGVIFRLVRKERAFPFGPGLAAGVLITLFTWRWIGPTLQLYLFEETLVLLAVGVMAAGLFLGSVVVRFIGLGRSDEGK